jgi:hypothetical protein
LLSCPYALSSAPSCQLLACPYALSSAPSCNPRAADACHLPGGLSRIFKVPQGRGRFNAKQGSATMLQSSAATDLAQQAWVSCFRVHTLYPRRLCATPGLRMLATSQEVSAGSSKSPRAVNALMPSRAPLPCYSPPPRLLLWRSSRRLSHRAGLLRAPARRKLSLPRVDPGFQAATWQQYASG